MANWKKVLVSGSNIEVNHITASAGVQLQSLLSNTENLSELTVDGSGNVTKTAQSNLAANSAFNLFFKTGSSNFTNFVASDDVMFFTSASNHGFDFTIQENAGGIFGANTHSIKLNTPQDLRIGADVTFGEVSASTMKVASTITHNGDDDTGISFTGNTIQFNIGTHNDTSTQNAITFGQLGNNRQLVTFGGTNDSTQSPLEFLIAQTSSKQDPLHFSGDQANFAFFVSANPSENF